MSSQAHTSNGHQAELHVFPENGAWHWGISIPRERGGGFQVVAYNRTSFAAEIDALADGGRALERLSAGNTDDPQAAVKDREIYRSQPREYMRERLRCAMARLVRSDEAHAQQAEKWVKAWGALIGEQHFEATFRKRPKTGAPEG